MTSWRTAGWHKQQLQSGGMLMAKKLTDRQRFERWARKQGHDADREVRLTDQGKFISHFANDVTAELWQAWQAAIRSERRRGKR